MVFPPIVKKEELSNYIGQHRINFLKLSQIVYIIADFTNYNVDAVDEYPKSDVIDQHFIRCPMQSDAVEEHLSDAVSM